MNRVATRSFQGSGRRDGGYDLHLILALVKKTITPKGPPTVVVVETSQLSKANKVTAEKMLHNVGVLNRYVYDFKQTSILGWASVSAILCNIANIYLMYISLDSE